jgi:Protein of unknown function, DUF547
VSAALTRRAVTGALALAALASALARAAPRAVPWRHWRASDESSTGRIDHSAWDGFLARYRVPGRDGIARLGYGRVLPADREALSVYIDALGGLPITLYRRAEQLPYWINLYNALTVRLVLEHYPVASILDIGPRRGHGPWRKKLIHIEGEEVSLDDIEHRILRPFWHDPRIHYALCLAALGSPDLAPHAFTAATTEAMLDAAARGYVNNPRGVRILHGRLFVSSLYVWYKADFGDSDRAVIAHLERYAQPALAAVLAQETRIAGDSFDWSLNDEKGV